MLGLIAATVAVSGCTSMPTGTSPRLPSGSDSDWCVEGQQWQSVNPATGERVQFEVQGTSTVNGTTVCIAVWETNANTSDDVARVEMQFTESGNYTKITAQAENGTVLQEFETSQ